MATIFSKIAAGEIPCYKIAENEDFLAFLDINPVAKGHTLVIPKQEIDYFFDLDNDTLCSMMIFAKEVAKALKTAISCKRIGLTVIGLEVPHAHIHLIPIQQEADMYFNKEKLKYSNEEFAEIAEKIRSNYTSQL